MITENLSTLKIHKLTKAQYERELAAGRIDENALYLTPDEETDLSGYATVDQLNAKADKVHNHDDIYYTETEIDAKLAEAKSYTDSKTSGFASTSSVNSAIATHNAATDAHADIRVTLAEVKEDVDAFFKDATISTAAKDTLKEIQEYITSDVEAAAAMTASINNKADKNHNHDDRYYTESEIDGKVAELISAIEGAKNDTAEKDAVVLYEAQKGINAVQTNLDALAQTVAGKADSGHGHDVATTSANGFMTADMVVKLNSVADGANKTIVDEALSSTSTNPVQNKTVNSVISTLTTAVSANTNSIDAHNTAITNLQTAIGEIREITSAEIQALFSK